MTTSFSPISRTIRQEPCFARQRSRSSGLLKFRRDESVSVLIEPIKPVKLDPHALFPSLDWGDEASFGLDDETEVDDGLMPGRRAPLLDHERSRERACWGVLSAQMRTVLQSILGYSELIEEDLVESHTLMPLADLLRIRSASAELLEMAEQIEDLLIMEREKRHVAEKLGALSRQLHRAIDREAIWAALLSSLATLLSFGEACILEQDEAWSCAARWGKYHGTEVEERVIEACELAAATGRPCVRELERRDSVMIFPIVPEREQVAALILRGDFDETQQADRAGLVMAFVREIEKALEDQRAFDQIKTRAHTDALTGALNRHAFLELAGQLPGARSVIMCDIDHFKRINDTHGHAGGDEVLREVVRRMHVALRDHDIIGRYGGEEFVIALEIADAPLAKDIAERVRRAIGDSPFELPDGEAIDVTASLGVVTGEAPLDVMMNEADALLYKAKQSGRDRVCV